MRANFSVELGGTAFSFYEDVDFQNLCNVRGELIPGMPIMGQGTLFVLDLEPEANLEHKYLYIALGWSVSGRRWVVVEHGWPPKEK